MQSEVLMEDPGLINQQSFQFPPCSSSSWLYLLAEKQNQEMDAYVHDQTTLLRVAVQRQNKQQLSSVMRSVEARAAAVMRMKDAEIAVMRNRAAQLEACLRRKEKEREVWEKTARESEALALSLDGALQQLKEEPCFSSAARGGGGGDGEETSSSSSSWGCDGAWKCKVCGARESCMLFLPCRHLCCCVVCDAFVDACPVCEFVKQGSVEIYMV